MADGVSAAAPSLLTVGVRALACSETRCTEEAMGSRWDAPPPPPNKCGFIAARLGRRASGVSRPRGTIISWVLSTERKMACRQRGRGRAEDRDDEAAHGGEEGNMVGAFSHKAPVSRRLFFRSFKVQRSSRLPASRGEEEILYFSHCQTMS